MFADTLLESAALRNLLQGMGVVAALCAAVILLEALWGGNLRRYRSRAFATDATYAVIYLGGIYSIVISGPVLAGIAMVVPTTWHLRVLEELPPLPGFLIYWIVADAIGYWVHRLEHASPLLWRVHSVHHTQTCLTFATSWRNHFLEQLFVNVLMYVPLMLLGMPRWYWLPAIMLQFLFEALQHSDLNWRYGRLYPVFVSPVFHAIHHDPDRARHDTNFGKILSIWDRLFGTMSRGERPQRYGLALAAPPVTFWETVVAPFRRPATRLPASTLIAERESPAAGR